MCGRGALQTIAEWFYTFTGGGVNDWAQVVVLVGRPFCLCWLNKDACRWWFGGGCWQYRTWMVSLFCIPCRIFRVMFRQLCHYINYLPRYVRTSELHSAVPSHSINQGRPHTPTTPHTAQWQRNIVKNLYDYGDMRRGICICTLPGCSVGHKEGVRRNWARQASKQASEQECDVPKNCPEEVCRIPLPLI